MSKKLDELKSEYFDLAHAMQSGVAMMMNHESSTSPKHLRVGVNSAMVEHGALIGLLIKKGVLTEEEVYEALVEGMRAEVERYKKMIKDVLGVEVELG